MFVTNTLGSLMVYPHKIHTVNQHNPESALAHNSFALSSATYEAKSTINNRKLVQFTFSHAIKAYKKRKEKLKTSNA